MTSPPAKSGAIVRALLVLFAATTLLLALHNATPPRAGLWQQTALNSSHVFVFALVALALFYASLQVSRWSLARRFGLVLLVAIAVGTASEVAQINTARDASFEDLVSNWLGAAGALLLAMACRRDLGTRKRSLAAIAAALVFVIALFPLLKVTAAYVERNANKATLVSFDAVFVNTFVAERNASLTILETAPGAGRVGRVTLGDGPWPGLLFHDLWPDWRAYSTLVIEIAVREQNPMEVSIRVHDRAHRVGEQPHHDRFNLKHTIDPGEHTLRIPLEKIRLAPHGREMDLSKIDGVVVFTSGKESGRSFDLISLRLE